MNLIVAVDENWGIGNKNELLIRIPNDQKMFRQKTSGNVVVLGRKTLETFPDKKPLKNRTNLILSKEMPDNREDAMVVRNVEAVLDKEKDFPNQEIFIIGGESVYRQFLPYCDTAYVTKINHAYEADAYFPNLDEDPEWEVTEESEEQTYFDITYTFMRYSRKK